MGTRGGGGGGAGLVQYEMPEFVCRGPENVPIMRDAFGK